MELAPDFDEFIASLTAHGVEFVFLEALEAFGFPVPDLTAEAIADRRRTGEIE